MLIDTILELYAYILANTCMNKFYGSLDHIASEMPSLPNRYVLIAFRDSTCICVHCQYYVIMNNSFVVNCKQSGILPAY